MKSWVLITRATFAILVITQISCTSTPHKMKSVTVQPATIEFGGDQFKQAWFDSAENARIVEFIPTETSLDSWEQMITFHCYPQAQKLKQVVPSYFESRKSLLALPPKAYSNKLNYYEEDAILVMFLGGPGKSQYIEFVIARFFRGTKPGVYAAIYSHRFPSNVKVDVSVAMENKMEWMNSVGAFKIPEVRKYCELDEV